MTSFLIRLVLIPAVVVACSKASIPNDQSTSGPAPGEPARTASPAPPAADAGLTPAQQTEWNAIEKLEAEAKAIANVAGCASSAECRSAPVGSRACGGPRYYISWCARTTDSASLYRKLGAIAKAEQDYNSKYQLASTCELRMPPFVESSGGSCVVK
ncbi:MAG TPA: hypothetical protein VHM24_09875 [Gemmatimonadaceae bacterium]|nr:hypothetical protein [Gemmatimonadaceae bacterium]